MTPKLFVIVLNYRRPDETIECVDSVLKSGVVGFSLHVLIVDNSEGEESCKRLQKQYPKLEVIHNTENLGYAEGNNVGIRSALKQQADYIFILNNDCIIESTTLSLLLHAEAQYQDTGILSPLVCRYQERTVIDACGTSMDWFRLRPREVQYRDRNDSKLPPILEAEIIPGAAIMLSKEVLNKLGFFDPDYFLIHEDADLSLRARRLGYKNRVVTNAVAYHKVSGTFNAYPALRIYYTIRNFLFLAETYCSKTLLAFVYAGLSLLSLKRILSLAWTSNGRSQLGAFFAGISDYFGKIRGKCKRPELSPGTIAKP